MDQATTTTAVQAALPNLGESFHGGKYGGITTDKDGTVYAVILLDDKPASRLNFQGATAWAASLGDGARLPNRVESLMLFTNIKDEFEEDIHWTGESYSERSAWFQNFFSGDQSSYGHNDEFCARAVRRLPINPSVL